MASSKSYRVAGSQPVEVDGEVHYPGDDAFTAKLDKTQEDFLVGIGALEVAKDSDKKDK